MRLKSRKEHRSLLPGFLENPFPLFKAARVFAALARLDGVGRVYLEAMALGLPLIGTTASGPAEILGNGKYGIMIPAEVEPLAEGIFALLSDDKMHAQYSRLSFERIDYYRPANIAFQWDDLLCNLTVGS